MRSGRYIGFMSGTSLNGADVVVAAIDDTMVAQQASLSWLISIALKNGRRVKAFLKGPICGAYQ